MAIFAFFANIVGIAFAVLVGVTIFSVFATFAVMILRLLRLLMGGGNDTVITIRQPVQKRTEAIGGNERMGNGPASSSFFDDAGDADLEYRGVGVAQDRAGAAALGAAVSKG